MRHMGRVGPATLVILCLVMCLSASAEQVLDLGKIDVMEERSDQDILLEPEIDVIEIDRFEAPGEPSNLADIVKHHPSLDFQGKAELMPEADSLFMRGFDGSRFTTALNGLTLRQSGGRKSSHIVDYGALLPLWMIERVEVIPGPHSALYPAKSIGGIVNVIPRRPHRRETLKPDVNLGLSSSSYDTHNHNLDLHGSAHGFVYDAGVQKFMTDGYLRNSEADITTYYARGGYVFEDQGHLTLSALSVDADREVPIRNDPDDPGSEYDSSYPVVESGYSEFNEWQDPTWDKEAWSYDLHFEKPTGIGLLSIAGSYREEDRDRAYLRETGGEIIDDSWETKWRHKGLRITDTFSLGDSHRVVAGVDGTILDDGYGGTNNWADAYAGHERLATWGAFAQDTWDLTQNLHLTLGVRYEKVKVWVDNVNSRTGVNFITGREDWIERSWESVLPKSFLTWELGGVADALRDTSVSLGVSRIWRAPDNHGEINPQGRPSGAWIEPEHGMGYDLTLQRRIWNDIQAKLNFSYYRIQDYIAHNSRFAQFTPGADPVPPGMEYRDWVVNLDRIDRKGAELLVSGHLLPELSFYVGYAYTNFENKGGEPAGETVLDGRAEHQVNAGLTYHPFENTKLLLDYSYQDNEVTQVGIETAPDEWTFTSNTVTAHNLVDVGVEQTLFRNFKCLENGVIKVFVRNLLDERYHTVNGYPGMDRTYGVALSLTY